MKKRNDKENKAQAPLRERRSVPPSGKSGSAEDFALHLAAMFRAELGEDDGTLDPLLNWELPASEADFQKAAAKPEDSGELLRAVANFLSDEVPAETPAPPAKPRRAEREAARSSVPERPAPPEARPAPQPEPDRGSARRREQAEARPARTERRPAELVPEAPQEPRRPGVEELFAAPGDSGASREGSRRPTAEELLADVVVSDSPREAARRPAAKDRSAESVPEASRKNSRHSADERRSPESPRRAGKPPRRADETPAPRAEAPKPRAEAPTPPPSIEAASAPTAEAAESDRLVFFEPNRKKKSFFDALADRPASLPEEAPAAAAKRPAPLPEEAPERKPRKPADRREAPRDTAVRRSEKQRRPQSEEQNTIPRSPRPDARRRSRTAARNTARVRVPAGRVSEDPTQLVLPGFDTTPFRPPQEDPPLEEIFAPLGLRTAPPTPDDTAVLSARATEKPAKASKAGEPAAKGWFGKRSRAKAEAEAEPQAQAPAPAEETAPPAEAPSPAEEAAPPAEASPAPPAPEENAPAASPAAEAPLPDSRLTVLEPYADDPEALAAVEREIPGLAELLAHAGVSLGQTPTPPSAETPAAPSDPEDASDALRLTLPAFPQEGAPPSASPSQFQAPADSALTLLFEEHGSRRSEAGQPDPQPAGGEREAEPEQSGVPDASAADSSRNADANSAPDAPAEAIPDRPQNAEASDELPAWAIFDHTQDAEPAPADDAAPVPPQPTPAPSKAARPARPQKRKRRWFSFLQRENPEEPPAAEAPVGAANTSPACRGGGPAARPVEGCRPPEAEPSDDFSPADAEPLDAEPSALEAPVGAATGRPPEAEPSDTELFDAESSDTEPFDAESPAADSPVGAAIGRPPEAEPSAVESPAASSPADADDESSHWYTELLSEFLPEAPLSDSAPELPDAEEAPDLTADLPNAVKAQENPAEAPAAAEAPDAIPDIFGPGAAAAPDAAPVPPSRPPRRARPEKRKHRWLSFLSGEATPARGNRAAETPPAADRGRQTAASVWDLDELLNPKPYPEPVSEDEALPKLTPEDEVLPEIAPEDEPLPALVPEDETGSALVPEGEILPEPVHEDEALPEIAPEDEALPDTGAAAEAPSDAAAAPEEADAAEDSETPAEGGAPELWDPLSLFDEPADEGPPPLTPLSQDATDSLPTLEELFGAAPPPKPAAAPAARAPSPRRTRQEKRRGWFRRWRNGDSLPQRDAAAEDAAPTSDAPADAPRNDAQAALSLDEAYVGAATGRPSEAEAFDAFSPADVSDTPPEPEPSDAEPPVGAAIGRPPEAEAFYDLSPADAPDTPPEPELFDAESPVGAAIGRPPEAEAFDDFSPADVPDTPPEPEPFDAEPFDAEPFDAEPSDADPPVGAAIGRPPEAEPSDTGPFDTEPPAAGQAAADEQSLEDLLASIDALLQPLPGQTLDLDAPTGDAAAPAAPLAAVPPPDEAAAEEAPGAEAPSDDWDPLALFGGQPDDAALPASWEDYLNSLRAPAPGAEPPAEMTETKQADAADPDAAPNAAEAPSAPEPAADASASTRRIDVEAPGAPATEPEPTLESIFGKPSAEPAEPETVPMDLREPERPAPQRKKRRRKSSGGALTLEDFLAAAVPMEETAPPRPETPPAQRKVQTRRPGPSGRDDTISTARENPEGLVLTHSEDRSAELPQPQAFGARPGPETPRPEEPTPSADAHPPLKPGRAPKASRREIDVMPPEEKTVLHPEEAYRVYARPLDEIGSRLVLTGLFTILSLFFTLYLAQRWTFLPEIFSGGTTVYLLLALLGLMVLVNRKLYFREWRGAQGLRPELLIGAATLFTALDCFSAARTLRPPFTVVVGALLLVALWGRYDRGLALLTTVKVLRNEKLSAGVGEVQDITKGSRGLIRTEPNVDRFMEKLETPDLTDRVLRWYTPVALVGGAVLTLLISLLLKQDFLWTGSLIFLGLVPVTGLLAYPRLFCLLASRLAGAQAALCGYHGAEAFGGEHAILIGDDDIFPAGSLTLNGFKVYSGNPDRIIAYAAAACRMSGSALDPVFEDLLVTHNGRHYTVDNFRFYDSGGIGASIQQDVVLMGSLDFMRRMGVHMDRGARVKQAVYMSLNGELAAVFAVRYAPPENLRRGLAAIAGNRHFKGILVTRTFLGTPSFLKVKFGIPTSAFQYPSTKERIRLSEAELKRTGAQGAILVQDSFSGFAQAAAGGRMLRSATLGAVILTLLGGAVGLVLMGVLAALPAYETATALNLLLYTAAWLAPTLLLTAWGRHF